METISISGEIISKRVAVGSKSECDGFFILKNDGNQVRVRMRDENAFMQPTLKSLVGKQCEATGFFHGYMFMALTIKVI